MFESNFTSYKKSLSCLINYIFYILKGAASYVSSKVGLYGALTYSVLNF